MLVYVEGYSYKEAADQIGVPIGTIMSRLAAVLRLTSLKDDVSERKVAAAEHDECH